MDNIILNETIVGTTFVNLHEGKIYLEYVDDSIGGYFRLPYTTNIEEGLPKVKMSSSVRYEGIGEDEKIRRHIKYTLIKIGNITEGLTSFTLDSFHSNEFWQSRNIVEGKMLSAITCKIIEMLFKEELINL